jgi:hypothetical protein
MKHKYFVITVMAALTFFCVRDARAWLIGTTSISDPVAQQFINQTLLPYQRQAKLVKGFANASAYSSHVATQRGYQGFDKFSITLGTMGAGQVPATTTNLGYYKTLVDQLRKQGDIYVGVAWNAWALNVGVKLPADFTISAKFGMLKYNYMYFKFDGICAGGMLNYQIVSPKSPPVKFILWRGLSIGTGLLWQRNNTLLKYKATPLSGGGYVVQPELRMFIKTESYVIPLEISTAVRLFWVLNIHAGLGIDFAMGSSRLNYSSMGTIAGNGTAGIYSVYGKQGGNGPTKFLPKIFCGPGLNFGPVIIDIPFTYYFNNGFDVGATFGIVW